VDSEAPSSSGVELVESSDQVSPVVVESELVVVCAALVGSAPIEPSQATAPQASTNEATTAATAR